MCSFNNESDYYIWLLDRIGVLCGEYKDYLLLAQHLFHTEYTYVLQMDENRAEAGLRLRSLYAQTYGVYEEEVYNGPCTVLEMLEALAERISFDTGDTIQCWFWEMLDNLGLTDYRDDAYRISDIDEILYSWMNRQYDQYGHGSIFPIEDCPNDMRSMEIWDQMNLYLTTYYPVDRNWLN